MPGAVPELMAVEDSAGDSAARRARLARPAVPDVQGGSGTAVSDSVRTRGLAHPSSTATARTRELVSEESVWQELEARGATIASVPFSGRAGRGGRIDRIVLHRVDGDNLVDPERWSGRDELCYALEAPVWDRFGSFAGQPQIVGTVVWTAGDRRVVIEGRRGYGRFEEVV